jgi:hypothetical protein
MVFVFLSTAPLLLRTPPTSTKEARKEYGNTTTTTTATTSTQAFMTVAISSRSDRSAAAVAKFNAQG